MKLSAEEIKERVDEFLNENIGVGRLTAGRRELLKLIEDATGEKIPEPFDESKVRHGSVWGGSGYSVVLFAEGQIGFIGVYNSTYPSEGDFRGDQGKIIRELKLRKLHYIGQYDFQAGLPKGAL